MWIVTFIHVIRLFFINIQVHKFSYKFAHFKFQFYRIRTNKSSDFLTVQIRLAHSRNLWRSLRIRIVYRREWSDQWVNGLWIFQESLILKLFFRSFGIKKLLLHVLIWSNMSDAPNQNGSGLEQQVRCIKIYSCLVELPRFEHPEATDNGGRTFWYYWSS